MSYNAARQSYEETSLKDILAVILENFGVSKQETDNFVSFGYSE